MDADRLAPALRRAVEAAESIDERLLMLLFVRKAEPVNELVEILGSDRSETMAALGRLSQARLVSHHRPEEGGAIHWFATAEGKTRGEHVLRAIAARLGAAAAQEPPAEAAEESPGAETPDHKRLKARRRVAIDQNEKTGFSWDT
jgi:DNA-binding MarR family transcriptional regulator